MAMPARDQVARVVHSEPDASAAEVSHSAKAQELRARPAEEPTTEAQPVASSAGETAKPKSALRRKILTGVGALAALGAIYFGVHYMLVGRYMVSTDDAYVRANNTTMGAKIAAGTCCVKIARQAGAAARPAAGTTRRRAKKRAPIRR